MYYQNPYMAMSPCMQQHPFMQTQGMMPEMALMAQTAPQRLNQDIYTYPYNFQGALDLIREVVAGEAVDRMFYEYLMNKAESDEDRTVIAGIRDDKIRQLGLFKQIYYELTSKMLQSNPEAGFFEPKSYCDGIRRALMGEQAVLVKYRKILFAMQDRRHINMLTDIITDALRHAILFNYLYRGCDCKS